MPRGARLDKPGTLHHVMVRGIERRDIVADDVDRKRFVDRMGKLAVETETPVYAWALMDNHVHIFLRSGPCGLPTFMRRLLTGYAVYYNRRHQRSGHLFQNRYKSIVCEEDAYFKELVRYIHLNPMRAKITETMHHLDRHKWCGHAVIVGNRSGSWQDTDYVLNWFGDRKKMALRSYREFVSKGIGLGRCPNLVGGGLLRSMGGWSEVKSMRQSGVFQKSDERILGGGEFVQALLKEVEQKVRRQLPHSELSDAMLHRIEDVCKSEGIDVEHLRSGSRRRKISAVRRRLCIELTQELGLSLAETARQLGVTGPAISQIMKGIERLRYDSYDS